MLSPVPLGADMLKVPRVSDLLEIVPAAVEHVPLKYKRELCTTLAYGASKAYEVAKQLDLYASNKQDESTTVKKARHHRDELLKLLKACLAGSCSLCPQDELLRTVTTEALNECLAFHEESKLKEGSLKMSEDIVLLICDTLKASQDAETLIISVFSLLCKFIGSENASIRNAVRAVFDEVDIGAALLNGQTRYEDAERRATEAEAKAQDLAAAVQDLQKKNESLQREVAALQASL